MTPNELRTFLGKSESKVLGAAEMVTVFMNECSGAICDCRHRSRLAVALFLLVIKSTTRTYLAMPTVVLPPSRPRSSRSSAPP